jgi:hypothetical protein
VDGGESPLLHKNDKIIGIIELPPDLNLVSCHTPQVQFKLAAIKAQLKPEEIKFAQLSILIIKLVFKILFKI